MRSLVPVFETVRNLMRPPLSVENMTEAARWILRLRAESWNDPRLCELIQELTRMWRDWYQASVAMVGAEAMRALLPPIEEVPLAYRKALRHTRLLPSRRIDDDSPLPRQDDIDTQMFDQIINDNARLRHWFATAAEPAPDDPGDFFPLRLEGWAIDGWALARDYRRRDGKTLDRSAYSDQGLAPEQALVEDFTYIFAFQNPTFKARTLLRRATGLHGFLFSLTPEVLAREMWSALLRLHRRGHARRMQTRRWALTDAGSQVAYDAVMAIWWGYRYTPRKPGEGPEAPAPV